MLTYSALSTAPAWWVAVKTLAQIVNAGDETAQEHEHRRIAHRFMGGIVGHGGCGNGKNHGHGCDDAVGQVVSITGKCGRRTILETAHKGRTKERKAFHDPTSSLFLLASTSALGGCSLTSSFQRGARNVSSLKSTSAMARMLSLSRSMTRRASV